MNPQKISHVLESVLAWSRQSAYRGYNKHDGLNSPILNTCLGWAKWPRIIAIQGVMRFPVNLRPLLMTQKVYNPKGLALFIQSFLDLYQLNKEQKYLDEALQLIELLEDCASQGPWRGKAWGYQYSWQDPGFFAPAGMPNAVVTSFVCEALLDAYRVTQNQHYLSLVASAIDFFLNDLTQLKNTETELCLGYMPVPMTMRVMDVSILVGTVISQYAILADKPELTATAKKLIQYVINQQTDYHAWYYTDPPSDSLITHDNYHTGFILDALWRYIQTSNDQQWLTNYYDGLEFYAKHHFKENGAPKWMHDTDYPFDIHGAAQGILTFSRHFKEYPGLADKIVKWSIDHMYHPSGRFYYQKRKYFTIRFTLLRWCNAWMCRALANHLLYKDDETINHEKA